jgi:hypothetical protein
MDEKKIPRVIGGSLRLKGDKPKRKRDPDSSTSVSLQTCFCQLTQLYLFQDVKVMVSEKKAKPESDFKISAIDEKMNIVRPGRTGVPSFFAPQKESWNASSIARSYIKNVSQ